MKTALILLALLVVAGAAWPSSSTLARPGLGRAPARARPPSPPSSVRRSSFWVEFFMGPA